MTRARPTLVFLGPSLPLAAAQPILPDATFLPPAAVGDVYRALAHRPARLALIDGVFEGLAAPWHKELLFAVERGVTVYGAASMGALRAAELAPLGMIPVGAIARAYLRGALTDDDEVAVAHLPAAQGFRAVSDAMVNLRAGLAAARRQGVIGARVEARLVALAKARFYRERSWETLFADARQAGVGARPLAGLAAFVARTRPDAKAADARALLRLLARTPPSPTLPRPRVRVARTWFWQRFVELAAAGATSGA